MIKFIPWLYIIAVPILTIANGIAGVPTSILLAWIIPATIIAFIAERYYEF